MNTRICVRLSFLALLPLVAITGLNAAEPPSIMRQTAQRYDRKINEVIGGFIREGMVPDAAVLLELRTIENDMLSLAVLSEQARNEMPSLVLSQKGLRLHDLRALPGLLIAARARTAGLDVQQDRLHGRTFTFAAPGEKPVPVMFFHALR